MQHTLLVQVKNKHEVVTKQKQLKMAATTSTSLKDQEDHIDLK